MDIYWQTFYRPLTSIFVILQRKQTFVYIDVNYYLGKFYLTKFRRAKIKVTQTTIKIDSLEKFFYKFLIKYPEIILEIRCYASKDQLFFLNTAVKRKIELHSYAWIIQFACNNNNKQPLVVWVEKLVRKHDAQFWRHLIIKLALNVSLEMLSRVCASRDTIDRYRYTKLLD